MAFFDNHIHIARLPQPLKTARELHMRGYKYRAIACEPWEWDALQDLWKKASAEGWMEGCGLSFGLHPMIAAQVAEGMIAGGPEDLWAELRRLLETFPEAQVGEAGLDKRYAGYESGGAQEKTFRRQAKMAVELGRDLQIHCVGDYGRVIRILREEGFDAGAGAGVKLPPQSHAELDSATELKLPTLNQIQGDTRETVPWVTSGARPVFHRFGGDSGIVKAGLSLGALFSIHADSYRKKATREALALIPAENPLFETDADETFVTDANETPQEVANRLVETLSGTKN